MDFTPQKKIIETGKGNICYFMAGPADAKQTVMLLHGLSSNHTTWLAFMETLAAQSIRCIAPDLRGHGFSDMSKQKAWYTFPVFADDIRRIAREERLQKFDMVGYSFGGYVALAYAIAHPDSLRSLALVSTNFMNPLQYGPFSRFTPAAIAFCETVAWLTRPQGRSHYYFEHGKSTGYFNSTFKGLFTMPLSINFWMLAGTLRLDLSAGLSRIICPALLVRSTSDPYLTEKEVVDMARRMPLARAVTITGDSHFLASRNQDLLAQELLPFLENPADQTQS
jgi:pimeloyl-ACP methyl ester carboxylesterase